MLSLSTLDEEAIGALCADLGAPRWRAAQIREALWRPEVESIDDIRQLPAAMRHELQSMVRFDTVEVISESEADLGDSVKLLCGVEGDHSVETVAMEMPASASRRRRGAVCVSTQVGCAVGCPFCATGRMGLRRSCTAAEIVDQVRVAARALRRRGRGPVTHVVYMGMGEPLLVYEATVESMRVLAGGAGISPRRMTVSTSGVVPAIDRLAGEGLPVTLAISLHAADDGLRDRLVPINRVHPIESLVGAGLRYSERTGRRLSFEWCLIGGVNDTLDQADGLRDIAWRARAHVNVIPMNLIEGSPWGPPDRATTERFLARLHGVRTTVRDTRGVQADAACGQLRAALEPRRALRPDGTLGPQLTSPAPVVDPG